MREVCRVGCTLLPYSVDSFSLHKRTYHVTRRLFSTTPPKQTETHPNPGHPTTPSKRSPTQTTVRKKANPSNGNNSTNSDSTNTNLSPPRIVNTSVPQPRKGAPSVSTNVTPKTVYVKKVTTYTEQVQSTSSTSQTTSTIYSKISNIVTSASSTTSTVPSTPATPIPTNPTPTVSTFSATSTTSIISTISATASTTSTASIISETSSISTSKSASSTILSTPTTTVATSSVSASTAPSFIAPNPLAVTSPFDAVPSSPLPDPSKFTVERAMISPYNDTTPPNKPVPKGPRFTILQYNILITQIDVVPQYYYCPEYAQNWEYRGPNLVREMRGYNPDIICMQEVDKYEFFNTAFSQDGYIGIYEPRPYKHLDGLALFFKKDKFKLIKKHVINYNKIHMPTKDPSTYFLENRFGFINRGKSKYETNNIALVCELETIEPTPRRLFVATTHIYWNPKMPELKVLQSYTLLKELEKIFQVGEKGSKSIPPLVITGDFNAMPHSGMYQLYSTRKLPHTHADIQSLVLKDLAHSIPISSAYSGLGEPLTNITKGFVGTLDYIWYANTQLALHRVLSPMGPETYLPNLEFSSDHAALMCELDFLV